MKSKRNVYGACLEHGCQPWQLGQKRLARWNREHGWASRTGRADRQREVKALQKRKSS
jgi:hypothetical protein